MPASPMPSPPPGCPMHDPEAVQAPPPIKSGCPVDHEQLKKQKQAEQGQQQQQQPQGACPVVHDKSELNKLNMMPSLNQERQPDQQVDLPTERVISSIPKTNDTSSKWEYPSPQQFYNALRRKGWETPEEEIETMVDIHNFLNEEAWNEVIKWENKFDCECQEDPYLTRFQGRPRDITPKARWYSWFGAPLPFDRHDWYVKRCNQERRYVIDYYEAPEETPGVPVFHLDVRPALDDFQTIKARFMDGCKAKWDEWFSASSSQ